MSTIKELIKSVPVLGGLTQKVYSKLIVNEAPKPAPVPFNGSAEYWETRYADGGNSGGPTFFSTFFSQGGPPNAAERLGSLRRPA